ncbi:FAD-binding oxidoreductase [Actinoplanes sp. LDG1-06]|uniref:D-lactate dehydrogenase (cytochrome) n=2 Tax=Paractinoplanes ovalisporus TaxID=2810368 RepID=A0ABS2A4B8_9ACTN|nr:FAD-binding oxidoreductase [Actinoplanes ovalisporus]
MPGAVSTRPTDRLRLARDASHFALTPSAVVTVASAGDVARLFAAGQPLTFRSGGTSLSGQGVTDGILVDSRRHFRDIEVLDDGFRVRVGPGATVRQVNTRLARYGRMLGPDPASEVACTLGGVVANNSSGMACGTAANSYALIDSVVVVLPSGTTLDTGDIDADDQLRAREPDLWAGLNRLRDRVRGNAASRASIERQFALKNTMGYGLNALLDHDRPADILTRLLVGSEGTLGFLASIVMRTVPVHAHARTGFLVFDDLAAATAALPGLVATDPAAIELLDATSLRVGQSDADVDPGLAALDVRHHAALLVEYRAGTAAEADARAEEAAGTLARLPLVTPAELKSDPAARNRLWHLRKGLYAKVAGARPPGTAALLEDIAVPVPELLPACRELIGLFERHAYDHAVIFGHAKDGNIHFMLTERLGDSSGRDRFGRFTDDMVDVVLGHGGTLKAEHGTGRMMTPFVRRQYGDELYDVMLEIKRLCDPRGILNPGVVLNDDPGAHLAALKTSPVVEEEVDRCVECGFCEPVCPSRDLTTTPRQRILLRRALEQARLDGDAALVASLEKDYEYDAVDTCAVDGMCQTACPVQINTGDLVRRLRASDSQGAWAFAARHWSATTRAMGAALSTARRLPIVAAPVSRAAHRIAGAPLWSPDLPGGGRARPRVTPEDKPDAILFSSCTGTMFGPANESFARLCDRAGVVLATPPGLPSLCCGTPWKSKGMTRGLAEMASRVRPALAGDIPVVVDAASCTEGLRQLLGDVATVVDAVEFTATHLLDRLKVTARLGDLALHPTCSAQRMGLTPALLTVAEAVAERVTVPDSWGCCGFAGDRGLLHPELTAAATAPQAAELAGRHFDAYASCNRTCELGMTRATGHTYEHVLDVLERVTR